MSQQPHPDQDPEGEPEQAALRARGEQLRRENPELTRFWPAGREEALARSELEFKNLIDRAQAGSQPALAELVDEYGGHILIVVRRRRKECGLPDNPRIRSPWQSSVAFESFETAIQKLSQFRGKSRLEFYAWLITICEHQEAERESAWSAQKRDGSRDISWERGLSDKQRQAAELCDDPPPDALAAQAEEEAALLAAVDMLGEPAREAIRLRYWAGLTYEQIGAKLGKGAKAVEGILRRGHKQVKNLLRRKQP